MGQITRSREVWEKHKDIIVTAITYCLKADIDACPKITQNPVPLYFHTYEKMINYYQITKEG